MVINAKGGTNVGPTRTGITCKLWSILGIACLIVALASTVQAAPPAAPEPRPINDLVKFLDIQIPGWQRLGDPKVVPIVKEKTLVTFITVHFRSGMKRLQLIIGIPGKDTVAQIMEKIPKEDAQDTQVQGFPAIKVVPPLSPYDDYNSSLHVNVAGRYVVAIIGKEVLDPDTLFKVADLIDLKKLAALPALTKK